ncbi:DUF5996 family protein [Povalibacter sp.]|uniref:DUF5996 family protein n=1 Tax=Povalibacter sp. TaxID=1962978 RepID=UPI002F3E811B
MSEAWPELPYARWSDTCATLQLWTQIIGKIRLSRTPWLNHGWQVALYVTSNGLTTSPIPDGARTFELRFDFVRHELMLEVSDGQSRWISLSPMSVADFYEGVHRILRQVGIHVQISDLPCEIPGAVAFTDDHTHNSYDPEYVERFGQVLRQADRIFKQFRTGFVGKSSPVHFFWGSFDLAVTRFSGRLAPKFTGTVPGLRQEVMQEAYSHEVSSAGFWPGNATSDAAFYSYAYPTPAGFREFPVRPASAFFSDALGEFLLPYAALRTASDPDNELLSFLQSTYEAAAISAKWDRASLECELGKPLVPRGGFSS